MYLHMYLAPFDMLCDSPKDSVSFLQLIMMLYIEQQIQVEDMISDLTPHQVLKLGQKLGLRCSTLEKMSTEYIHGEMAHAWLIKEDDVLLCPTWRSLAKGLAEQGQWEIVDMIRESKLWV